MRYGRLSLKARIRNIQIEKICSAACFVAAVVFLIVAILGAWRYFVISGICLAASFIVSDRPGRRK